MNTVDTKRRLKLRIGTWNVDTAAAARIPPLSAILAGRRADIWVLTETHDALTPGAEFAPIHAAQQDITIAPRRLRVESRWVSIWSRFPVQRPLETSDSQRTGAALLDTPFGTMVFFGTVLPWPGSRPSFASAVEEQARDWLSLKHQHPEAPLFVAGDFNCDLSPHSSFPGVAGTEALRKATLATDLAFATADPNLPKGLQEVGAIDHVLVPQHLLPATKIVDVWNEPQLSDHRGIIVEIDMGAA